MSGEIAVDATAGATPVVGGDELVVVTDALTPTLDADALADGTGFVFASGFPPAARRNGAIEINAVAATGSGRIAYERYQMLRANVEAVETVRSARE